MVGSQEDCLLGLQNTCPSLSYVTTLVSICMFHSLEYFHLNKQILTVSKLENQ